jgi:hypothetical protein
MPLLGRSPLTGVIEDCMEDGWSLDELTVLARDNDPFRQDRDEGHKLGRWPAEEDHLVPLELGGSNDITNQWPEAGKIPNPQGPGRERAEAGCLRRRGEPGCGPGRGRPGPDDRPGGARAPPVNPPSRPAGRPEQPRAAGISAGRSLRQQNRTEHKKESHARHKKESHARIRTNPRGRARGQGRQGRPQAVPAITRKWVIVDEAGNEPGWSTSGDLDELEEYIDAVEIS